MEITATIIVNHQVINVPATVILPEQYQKMECRSISQPTFLCEPNLTRPLPNGDQVYLIQVQGSNRYKIGYTGRSPSVRLRELQTGCPDELILVGVCPGGLRLEQTFHELFKSFHLKGEWFQFPEEEVQTIKSLMASFRFKPEMIEMFISIPRVERISALIKPEKESIPTPPPSPPKPSPKTGPKSILPRVERIPTSPKPEKESLPTPPPSPPKQSPKTGSKSSPKDSPKSSPKTNPKSSPKILPGVFLEDSRPSPKVSEKSSPKDSSKPSPKVSEKSSPKDSPNPSPKDSPKTPPVAARSTDSDEEPKPNRTLTFDLTAALMTFKAIEFKSSTTFLNELFAETKDFGESARYILRECTVYKYNQGLFLRVLLKVNINQQIQDILDDLEQPGYTLSDQNMIKRNIHQVITKLDLSIQPSLLSKLDPKN